MKKVRERGKNSGTSVSELRSPHLKKLSIFRLGVILGDALNGKTSLFFQDEWSILLL